MWLWLASSLLLLGVPAGAAPFYESTGAYRFGTGATTFRGTVDVATGAFRIRQQLATLQGRLSATGGWFFNSQDASNGPLGKGTSLPYDWFIAQSTVLPGQPYVLIAPGNRQFVFDATPNANGDYINSRDPMLLGATLDIVGGVEGTLRWKDGTLFSFDSTGGLVRIDDRHGNYLTILRNTAGFTRRVGHGQYHAIWFTYGVTGNGKVTKILFEYGNGSPLNREWSFAYDGSGRLSTVTDPAGGVTTYTWTTYTRADGQQLPLIDTITNPRGIVELNNDYDSSGRVTKQTFGNGKFLTVNYSAAVAQDGSTTMTDPNENSTRWDFAWIDMNADPGIRTVFGYNISKITRTNAWDPNWSEVTQFERALSPTHLVTKIIDHRLRETTLGWDGARGNLTSITRPGAVSVKRRAELSQFPA